MRRPEGWVDPREFLKTRDLSKVRRYTSDLGFTYWIDPVGNRIQTDRPGVCMTFHQCYGFDYIGHSYAKMHVGDEFAVITNKISDPKRVSFSPDFSETSEDGAQIWHVGELFRVLELPDNETYPWVEMISLLPRRRIEGIDGFRDEAEQTEYLSLIQTLLSCHDGVMFNAIDGSETRGRAVFGSELTDKIRRGALIK